jgi:hypothetical protein
MGALAYNGHRILQGPCMEALGGKGGLIASILLPGLVAMAVYAFILDLWGYPERDMLRGFLKRILGRFSRHP